MIKWLASWVLATSVGGCGTGECPRPAPCAKAPECPAPAGFDVATVKDRSVRLALDTLQYLLAAKYEPVRALFTPALRDELPADKLDAIVRGLVAAHGPVLQVTDAWRTEIEEKTVRMPAAQVLIRMTNDTRVDLMLVFDPQGAVKGLWMRPI